MSQQASERLLTTPLVLFLVLVLALVSGAIFTRHPSPDIDGSIQLLADGDLDFEERQRMLLRIVDLAKKADAKRQLWAGLLAAVVLQDRASFRDMDAKLGVGIERILPEADLQWLTLGDVVVANVYLAMVAEASGDKQQSRAKWSQVAAQSRVTGYVFAGELAAAAMQRLKE